MCKNLITIFIAVILTACSLPNEAPITPGYTTMTPTLTIVPSETSTPARPTLNFYKLYWFAPLPPMPTGPGRNYIGSDDFMNLFTPDAKWGQAAGHIQVFKLYGEWVAYHATDAQLRQAVQDLQRRGLALAVEAGPLDAPANCGQGVESFAGIEEGHRIARRIKAAGGTIDLIGMDEPYFFAHVYDGPNACHWSEQKIAEQVGKFIEAMTVEFPNVIVGDTEPLAGQADAAAYKNWLDIFNKVNGYDLAFLHMDIDWSRPKWPQEVKQIEDYGRMIGVPIGIIYTGNAFDSTDEAWLNAAGERVKKYELGQSGQPNHVLFQSWHAKPDHALPEDEPFTFTQFIDAYFEDKSALGFPRTGVGANLALEKPVQVSNQYGDNAGALAVDGDTGTLWNSGSGPTQWIEIDLGAVYNLKEFRLTISQYPAGETTHQLLVKGPGTNDAWQEINTFRGNTDDGNVLTYTPPQAITGIQFVRVETINSPSWVAWREIEVIDAGK